MQQHPVPNQHLLQIGDMTVSFAMLEHTLQRFLGSLILEHQRVGQILSAELPFKTLRALIISLYVERHGQDVDFKALRNLLIRAGKVEEKRNQITHSVWGQGKDKDHITRIKMTAKEKAGLQFVFEDVSDLQLKEFVDSIKELCSDVSVFHSNLILSSKVINSPINKLWP